MLRKVERSSPDLIDILCFVRVVETGSFAAAAERMTLSKPVVSRRVARLEASLGTRLLTRTARGAAPTEIGRAYHERAARILADLETAGEEVAAAVTQISGPIRLTAPISFGLRYLGPALADFAKLHPEVALDVSLEDRIVDLVGGGFDLGLRIGRLRSSALRARRLAPIRTVVAASPSYLEARGRPDRPAALADHDLLVYSNRGAGEQWRFRTGRQWQTVRGHVRLRSDSGDLLCAAAVAGLGVAVMPSFILSDAIRSGALEVILHTYPVEELGLHAVMPPGRAATARVRALVDFLADRFGPEPDWDPCWEAERDRGGGPARPNG